MSHARIQELDRDDDTDLRAFRTLDREGAPGPLPVLPDDARLLVAKWEEGPLARASLRLADDLAGAQGRTGIIGHYEARDEAAGVTLLRESLARLLEAGAERVVGPMDGTTWDRYRLALPSPAGNRPPFLTEPVNPYEYPRHFEAAGMDVVEWYVSQIVEDLGALAERTRAPAGSLEERGVRLETLDPDAFDAALDELYRVSIDAFADNPYFSPISFDRFRALYAPMKNMLDPDLVLVARGADGEALGFTLSFPDLLDPAGRPTRVVVKTLAVAPAGRGMGLGSLLVHETHRRAAERGYNAAIHALMHVGNDSLKISSHGGRVFRHYALYGWTP
jgi:GNAT superfamily N-acetyltransferase